MAETADALGETLDAIFGVLGRCLMRDGVHYAEHVVGAMVNLTHKQVLPFLVPLAFFLAPLALCNVLAGTDHADGAPLGRVPLEMRKPAGLHPPHFAVSPSDPKLGRIALRIGGIERRFDGCPNLHVPRPKLSMSLRPVDRHPKAATAGRRLSSLVPFG